MTLDEVRLLVEFRCRYRGLTWDQLGALFGLPGVEAWEIWSAHTAETHGDCSMIDRDLVEALIAASRSDAYIAGRTGYPIEAIAEIRIERRRRVAREKSQRQYDQRKTGATPPPLTIEEYLARRWSTEAIISRTGCSAADVDKARCRLKAARLDRKTDDSLPVFGGAPAADDGRLIIALRAHLPPLTSLPDRVAALGIPVWCRRAA